MSSKTESSAKVSISGQLSHQWNISQFSSFANSNEHLLTSEDFTCADLNEWTVFLRLWPNGRTTVNANYLSLYLYILAPVETDLKVQYQMSIIDLANVECNYTKSKH